jgi:hypothetical protein
MVARIKKLVEKPTYQLCRVAYAGPRVNLLELTFNTAELRDICEKRAVATEKLGYAAARELADRLADIEALDNVADLIELLGQAVCDCGPGEKSFRLEAGFDVVFKSAHPAPSGDDPEPKWSTITRMKILAIEQING